MYKALKILLTANQVEIVNKKEFAIVLLSINNKFFMIYVITQAKPAIILINFFRKTKIALLTSAKICVEYFDFFNIIFLYSMAKLIENT